MAMEGSPAHAGIDRGMATLLTPARRFPRTRGDRPAARLDMWSLGQVPPHTRG